jgi:hypothetical protein
VVDVAIHTKNMSREEAIKYMMDNEPISEQGATAEIERYMSNPGQALGYKVGAMKIRDGKVDTQCDRCGNALTVQLWDEFNLIIKLVDEPDTMNSQEEDPDIYYIDRNENHFSVATWVYEFITLSFPIQHICKENEKGESTCNQKTLAELQKLMSAPLETRNENVWKGLDKFKQALSNELDDDEKVVDV